MISSSLKNFVSGHMKNMEVVAVTARPINNVSDDSGGAPSLEELRRKYLGLDSQPQATEADAAADAVNEEPENVEVALLRKKNFVADDKSDDADQRTIINSKENGLLGAQG
ncbi:MAG: hypothetical protein JWP78_2060 [Mucilaginibacter sp.]|nr:hypothetical protein [Mucilaginibacter sp.]